VLELLEPRAQGAHVIVRVIALSPWTASVRRPCRTWSDTALHSAGHSHHRSSCVGFQRRDPSPGEQQRHTVAGYRWWEWRGRTRCISASTARVIAQFWRW